MQKFVLPANCLKTHARFESPAAVFVDARPPTGYTKPTAKSEVELLNGNIAKRLTMKTVYVCPECQKTFKETPSPEDFTAKCPHCATEVSIQADPTLVEWNRIETEKKEEAARKEAERKANEAADQAVQRKQEEEDAKAVALVQLSLKRICPHCGNEATLRENVKPGVASFVVRCNWCGKKFTILNSSDNLTTFLSGIHAELEVIRYRFGVLLVCLFVIPAIVGIIFAIIHAN